jgi:hypothetical protein
LKRVFRNPAARKLPGRDSSDHGVAMIASREENLRLRARWDWLFESGIIVGPFRSPTGTG